MDANSQDQDHDGKRKYLSPRWVQVWFLRRSRDNWKRKCKQLKADAKRLQNRVNDVTHSREKWREQAEREDRRLKELQAENTALREQQQAALKKDASPEDMGGSGMRTGRGRRGARL
jgi:hypothetical protein